jgi:hypothetical protein
MTRIVKQSTMTNLEHEYHEENDDKSSLVIGRIFVGLGDNTSVDLLPFSDAVAESQHPRNGFKSFDDDEINVMMENDTMEMVKGDSSLNIYIPRSLDDTSPKWLEDCQKISNEIGNHKHRYISILRRPESRHVSCAMRFAASRLSFCF